MKKKGKGKEREKVNATLLGSERENLYELNQQENGAIKEKSPK